MQNDLWVFGYGSLMWRPGFVYAARHKAVVHGWRAALHLFDRLIGVPEKPGIVLGLDAGGECVGWLSRSAPTCASRRCAICASGTHQRRLHRETRARAPGEWGKRRALTYVADRNTKNTPRRCRASTAHARSEGRGESARMRNMSLTRAINLRESALSIRSWNGLRPGCGRGSRGAAQLLADRFSTSRVRACIIVRATTILYPARRLNMLTPTTCITPLRSLPTQRVASV